jgi:hypothetical protein
MNIEGTLYPDKLVTVGTCPGYRALSLHLELNRGPDHPREQVEVRLDQGEARRLMSEILLMHEVAWRDPGGPLDLGRGENPFEGCLRSFLAFTRSRGGVQLEAAGPGRADDPGDRAGGGMRLVCVRPRHDVPRAHGGGLRVLL